MLKTDVTAFREIAMLLLASAGALSGCGEAGFFSREEMNGLSDAKIGSEIDQKKVTVEYRSTRCGENAAVPCPEGMGPGVEIYVEARSVIFDFSEVEEPGVFSDVDFEGFILELAADSNSPILFAKIDALETNLDIDIDDLSHDARHLDVNFAGVAYDSDGFVKIDLLVGPLNLLGHGG